MSSVYTVVNIFLYTFLALLAVGLWKPWMVLWWLPYKNRIRVLKYYGIPVIALLLTKTLILFFN